jgi:hypothetical protein
LSRATYKCKSVTIFVMFFVGRLILRELPFIYKNKLYMFLAKSENAMLWRMLSRLETCIVYSCIWRVTLAKSIVPRKTWRKLWHSYIYKLLLTKMQVTFSIEASSWTLLHQNRKLSSRISLQNQLFLLVPITSRD